MRIYSHPEFKVDEIDMQMSVDLITSEQIVKNLIEAFHRDAEGKFRQALIDMGWTPPPDIVSPVTKEEDRR